MGSIDLDAPQLGEHAWHAFTEDGSVGAVSQAHKDRIASLAARYLPGLEWTRSRILEIGAYRHYSGNLLAAERGGEFVATDIAASSLRAGRDLARAAGVTGETVPVVADFHDLPFSDNYFDVVFVASSVHHTRRPEQVLSEMLRVLRPGGILILDNEPCARACCFHAFVTNRQESFTPYEAALHRAGLLATISSPFWGARGEQLFGMVENDRIPLSLYMDAFTAAGTVVERRLSLDTLIGEFERTLIGLRGGHVALRARTKSLLDSAVARAREGFGETERLLGFALPTECDVHELAGNVANLLARRPAFGNAEEWQAELFGAALAAVVRKRAGAPAATQLFRREMVREPDGLLSERTDSGSVAGSLGLGILPNLHSAADASAMAQWFPVTDWQFVVEAHGGRSMVNRAPRSRIVVPMRPSRTLLLIRYYAVVTDNVPFRVRVWGGGRLLDDQVAVVPESRLVRAWVPPECGEIIVEACGLDERPSPGEIHMGVFQQFETAISPGHP